MQCVSHIHLHLPLNNYKQDCRHRKLPHNHQHKKGSPHQRHTHKVTTELTYIVEGELMVSGKHLKAGDMWTYGKKEISDVECLTDVSLIVVRWPSIPSDKYLV